MKKSILSLAILASTAVAVNAQSIAPEVGMNYSKITTSEGVDRTGSKIGLRVGANVNFPIANNLYLSPGIFYTNKGGENTGTKVMNNYSVVKYDINYLEIPVNLVYRMPLSVGALMISGGGYYAYGLNGSYSLTNYNNGEAQPIIKTDATWGSGTTGWTRSDFGLNAGVGYELPIGLYVRGQYQHGLVNFSNQTNTTAHNAGFILSLGYNLKGWNR